MSQILVFLEHKNGQIKKSSLELLTAAKNSGSAFETLALGAGSKNLAETAGSFGAQTHHCSESDLVKTYNSELYSETIGLLVKEKRPSYILATASLTGKDLFPRIGAKTQNGTASDCISLNWIKKGPAPEAKICRPLFSGKAFTEVEFKNSATKIILMRPNSLEVETPAPGKAAQTSEISLPPTDLKTIVKNTVQGVSTKTDLTEAKIIVAGGRGLKGPENFKLLDSLAAVLGASVGASRAVVDAGWAPHDMQVGQTGKTVSPTLYIACGISGAIQHLAGMNSSKVIVAINKDKEAPIFQKATYGIVGDALEILPLLTSEFKKILQ